jgi:hypothetical protein
MKRIVILFLMFYGLPGCKSQTPSVDPFFGRTTIPPPATGSISGSAKDPYYQSTPPPQPNPAYSPGITPSNPSSLPGYSGSGWTNPSNTTSSVGVTNAPWSNPSSTTNVPTTPSYPLQQTPQNYPGSSSPSANIPQQTPYAFPGSAPATSPSQTAPAGNRYTPPGGNYNYRGAGLQTPNPQGTTPSSNRIYTPFFTGGTPNRTSIPIKDTSPRPIDDSGESTAGAGPNVSSPAVTYNPGGSTGGSNISLMGRSPIIRTLQPQTRAQTTSPGNNYSYPAGRSGEPAQLQVPNDSIKPAWRESTSFASPLRDDNIETVSDIETTDE